MVNQKSRNTENKNRHDRDHTNIIEHVEMCCHTEGEMWETSRRRIECINVATVFVDGKPYCDTHLPEGWQQ